MKFEDLHGRLVDCDSHLHPVPSQFPEILGTEFGRRYWDLEEERFGAGAMESWAERGRSVTLDAENVWTIKGWGTPAAFDLGQRLFALDLMGIDRQVLFPVARLAALAVSRMDGAVEAAHAYNDYVLEWSRPSKGRLRPVAMLPMHDVEAAISECERVLAAGALAVNIACSRPPAGLSPADPAWDPLWSMLAEANVPALIHLGGESGFIDRKFGDVEHLKPRTGLGGGEAIGVLELATFHMAPQTYVSAMILGGVFERHPALRLGVIELAAQWVGPMAETLDQRAKLAGKRLAGVLSMEPSAYLARNVRVTPFHWEPIGVYIERYGLKDVYVFSTDFPHPEGGTTPIRDMYDSLERLGDEVVEKYFVSNAESILPAT